MLGLFDLVGDLGDTFWGRVLVLALSLAFGGLLVHCRRRPFSDLLVGVGSVDVSGVHFEDFPEAFELEGVEFA